MEAAPGSCARPEVSRVLEPWRCSPAEAFLFVLNPTQSILIFRSPHRGETEWKSTEQRVPILWTACHFGGRRPWFRCPVYSNGNTAAGA